MRADEPYEGQKGTNAMKSVFYYDTPIGRLGLAENGRAVTDVLLHGEHPADAEIRETPLLQKAAEQLAEYFGGLRTEFELPLEFEIGTPFERTVWQALSTIPYGETRSYADIARQIGRPAACRAVGRANGRNPLSIFVPCHRVIGASGQLTGYGGGLDKKEALLRLEGVLLRPLRRKAALKRTVLFSQDGPF